LGKNICGEEVRKIFSTPSWIELFFSLTFFSSSKSQHLLFLFIIIKRLLLSFRENFITYLSSSTGHSTSAYLKCLLTKKKLNPQKSRPYIH
jgi:hypothetical protein